MMDILHLAYYYLFKGKIRLKFKLFINFKRNSPPQLTLSVPISPLTDFLQQLCDVRGAVCLFLFAPAVANMPLYAWKKKLKISKKIKK
jgi:hypothetical protein